MNRFLIAGFFLMGFVNFTINNSSNAIMESTEAMQPQAPVIAITYPKHDQKVRGEIKIYGRAKPGAVVKLRITSTYFKKAYQGERILKGEGPIKRLNRSFTLTANRSGTWMLERINLTNAGWEENFTIKASADGRAVSINVYDHSKPVNID